jgi:hypothetical protein
MAFIASKIGGHAVCLALLKIVGIFKSEGRLTIGKGKNIVNVALLVLARDTIDKWIQNNRAEKWQQL